jgi:16S rRNA (uracil1498-N3)-methyltransferase
MIRMFASGTTTISLTPEDAHHLLHVLRVQINESLELLIDGEVYAGTVRSLHPLQIEKGPRIESNHELPFAITLIYPLSKGERFDWVVQKATELGVVELIPCSSERTVVQWHRDQLPQKFNRYRRMIAEATLQSKREKMMMMTQYLPLKDALEIPFDMRLVASEYHLDNGQHLLNLPPIQPGTRIGLLIGPEGGFSQTEMTLAIAKGYQPISLGNRILRTETAVTVALGLLSQKIS